jgi:antitoxin (DNA-binding transcriptional repressor) of toxin-antitoxin stability system
MEFIPVRDLRVQPGEVWRKLREQRDLVITSRGQPIALLLDVEGDLEQALLAVRRARAQLAVSAMREASQATGLDRLTEGEVEAEIRSAREERQGR